MEEVLILHLRSFGDHKHCRKILQRALNSVTDWPESICDAYIIFEREEGTELFCKLASYSFTGMVPPR